MKLGPLKSTPLDKIIAPGDLRARMAAEHVEALADSIARHGGEPIHPLLLRRGRRRGLEINSGRDRYSALRVNKASHAPTREILEATPLELLELEIEENLHRRPTNRDALVAELVERAAKLVPAPKDADEAEPSVRQGRKNAAREVVAKAMDTSVEAVRSAERRHEAREEAALPVEPGRAVEAPLPIETWGLPMASRDLEAVTKAVDGLAALDKLARQAQALVTGLDLPQAHGQRLKAVAHELGALARQLAPAAICPYCLAGARSSPRWCGTCASSGIVRVEQLAAIPRELKVEVDETLKARAAARISAEARRDAAAPSSEEWKLAVASLHALDGTPCACSECVFAAKKSAPAKTGKKRRMTVELPNGSVKYAVDLTPEDIGPAPAPRELTVEREDDDPWTA